MKIKLDDILESVGPFVILSVDKHNELKGKIGMLEDTLSRSETSNEFLRNYCRKLEDRLDGKQQ